MIGAFFFSFVHLTLFSLTRKEKTSNSHRRHDIGDSGSIDAVTLAPPMREIWTGSSCQTPPTFRSGCPIL